MQIVTEKYSEIINNTKVLLEQLQALIDKHSEDSLNSKISSAIENLDNLFLIVFMGEFSTGKSSVINALIGEKILEEGITPTTDKITIIKYGEKSEHLEEGIVTIEVPNKKLENTVLVDTPGTNVTIEQHKKITEDFIPKSDIIFFTIAAERAVTSSEYEFVKHLKDEWKKNIIFLLNKTDIAENPEELEKLIDYAKNELARLFGTDPVVIPISAKLELQGKQQSGFDDLNNLIFRILSHEERLRIKLNNSIDLSLNLAEETEKAINHDLSKISSDIEKLSDFDMRVRGMKEDIVQNSSQFTERIKGRLLEFKNRGVEFIDGLIRFENVFKLIRKEKIAKEFEQKVSHQTLKEIEKDLDDMVLWIENSSKKMIEDCISFYKESIDKESYDLKTPFIQNRIKLIDTVRTELEIKRNEIDPNLLGGNLVDSARSAVASVLGVQVGSLALGATVVSAFSSFIIDITGVLTTLAVMATAFAILPKKRSNAMKEFSETVDNLSNQLTSNIRSQLERDMDNVELQVIDTLGPLKNFYKTQKQKNYDSKNQLEDIKQQLMELKQSMLINKV